MYFSTRVDREFSVVCVYDKERLLETPTLDSYGGGQNHYKILNP